jgi:membrane protease YdiL (CAAX protease family)
MSIVLALGQPAETPLIEFAAVLGCIGVAVSIAAAAGVFHRRSVVGPVRIAAGEQTTWLWMVFLFGLGAWFLVQAYLAQRFMTEHGESTTAPATQMTLSLVESAVVSTLGEAALLLSLVVASSAFRPGGLGRLGFGLPSLRRSVLPGAIAVAAVLPFMYAVLIGTQTVYEALRYPHPAAHPLLEALQDHAVLAFQAMVAFSAVVIAPIAEELLFRGQLQTALVHALAGSSDRPAIQPGPRARWLAILLVSATFAMFHPAWMRPPLFLLSVCIGYAYERTGNLWVAIIIHAGFNAFNVINVWTH